MDHSRGHLTNDGQARIDFLLGQVSNDGLRQDLRHDVLDVNLPRL